MVKWLSSGTPVFVCFWLDRNEISGKGHETYQKKKKKKEERILFSVTLFGLYHADLIFALIQNSYLVVPTLTLQVPKSRPQKFCLQNFKNCLIVDISY